MIHLIYVSQATSPLDKQGLESLLVESRNRNEQMHITGMLLYVNDSFIQVLEGEEAAVNNIYLRIQLDKRNKNNCLLLREPIAMRSFPHWSMGFKLLKPEDYPYLDGYSDFINYKMEGSELVDADLAVKLLYQFKEANLTT